MKQISSLQGLDSMKEEILAVVSKGEDDPEAGNAPASSQWLCQNQTLK